MQAWRARAELGGASEVLAFDEVRVGGGRFLKFARRFGNFFCGGERLGFRGWGLEVGV
jgi:hypothetical protein